MMTDPLFSKLNFGQSLRIRATMIAHDNPFFSLDTYGIFIDGLLLRSIAFNKVRIHDLADNGWQGAVL